MKKIDLDLFLPRIVSEITERIHIFDHLNIPKTLKRYFKSGSIKQAAITSGLILLPPKKARELQVVIDVGSNIGDWTAALLKCITPRKIICLEPNPVCAQAIRKRLQKHNNVSVIENVIGKENGFINFNITRDPTGSSVLNPLPSMKRYIGGNWTIQKNIRIKMKSLDSLCKKIKRISLLKIDVQGFEKEVLTGSKSTLKRTSYLLIELNFLKSYKNGSTFCSIYKTLTEQHKFRLYNLSSIRRLGNEASYVDALFYNPRIVKISKT